MDYFVMSVLCSLTLVGALNFIFVNDMMNDNQRKWQFLNQMHALAMSNNAVIDQLRTEIDQMKNDLSKKEDKSFDEVDNDNE